MYGCQCCAKCAYAVGIRTRNRMCTGDEEPMHSGAWEHVSEKKIGSVRHLLLHMASGEDSMHVSGRGGAPTEFQTYKIREEDTGGKK